MRAQLLGLAAVAALLTACGSDTSTTPTAEEVHPSSPPAPHWPAHGCDTRSRSFVDHAADAPGAPSRQAALAHYVDPGTHVVREHRAPHRERGWLVVKRDGEIVRAVYVESLGNGWLVSGVEQCSR